MKSIFTTFVLALCLAGCTTPLPSTGPWYQGTFDGQLTDGVAKHEISATCSLTGTCSLRVANKSGPTPSPLYDATISSAPLVEASIPNNNLDRARRLVRADPTLFNDPAEGPLLAPLSLETAVDRFKPSISI